MTNQHTKTQTDDQASGSKSFVNTVRRLFRSVFPKSKKSSPPTTDTTRESQDKSKS